MNNELFGKVKRPTEAVIDGRTMNLLGNTLNDVTRSANRGVSAFDTMGFLARVAAKLAPNAVGGGDDEDGATADGRRQRRRLMDDDAHAAGWTVVGRMAAKHTCRIPVADFMLGPLNLPPKAKKTRKPIDAEASQKRKEKRKEAPQTQPQHFDAAAQEAEPETSREVQRIHRLLGTQGGEQGVPFFKFICHPDSFARSVENLFHLSFLRACGFSGAALTAAVKEGKATLDKDDESDAPIVSTFRRRGRAGKLTRPVVCQPPDDEQKTQAAAADEAIVHTSVMFEFTQAIWKEAIDRYEITEAMIPHQK